MDFLKQTYAIAWKDVAVELQRKEIFTAMFFFATLTLFVFNFAMGPEQARLSGIPSGLLWLAFTFTSILGLGKSFLLERENRCLDGILLCPVDRSAIYLGKLLGNLLFMLVAEALTLPLFLVFFNLPARVLSPQLLLVVLLGTVGISSVGTLFSAMTANIKARELMLPLLLFPVIIPVLLAAVKTTEALLNGQPLLAEAQWLKLLIGFDVIFVVICLMAFEFVVEQ